MKFKTRQLFLSALISMALSAGSAYGEVLTVTDNLNITANSIYDYIVVGNNSTAGYLNIAGTAGAPITVNTTGGTPISFRSKSAGVLVSNGTIAVSNANLRVAEGTGVYSNAPSGHSANIIINEGGFVYSHAHPAFAADFQTNGSMVINAGGEFECDNSFYVGGWGHGSVTLNGGTLDINNGMQIGRDYEVTDGYGYGDCEGAFLMTGGKLEVQSYGIIGRNQAKEPTHVNTSDFTMTGGQADFGSYFCISGNPKKVDPAYIKCTANIGGGTNLSTLTVTGNFGISNGEGLGTIDSAQGGIGIFNVYDNAKINADGGFIGIGANGTLSLNGGLFKVGDKAKSAGITNAGTVKINGGTLEGNITNTGTVTGGSNGSVTGNIYNNNNGIISVGVGESLTVGGYVTVGNSTSSAEIKVISGVFTISNEAFIGDKGTGSLNIGGTGEMTAKSFTAGKESAAVGNITVYDQGKLSVTGVTSLASAGTSTFTVSDNAEVTLTGDVTNGGKGTMSLFGGTVTAASNFINKGVLNISGGVLNVTGDLTNNNDANTKFNLLAGTTGIGKLNIDGALTNKGTINVGVGNGLALFGGYDKDQGITVATVKGTKPESVGIVKGAVVNSVAFSGDDLVVKLTDPAINDIFDAACGSFALDEAAASGWVSLGSFVGNDPYVFTLNVQPGTGKTIDDFVATLGGDLIASGNSGVTASAAGNQVQINGLTAEDFDANVFAWNFTDGEYGTGAGLLGMKASQVPEPATWVMLILGIAGIGFYRKRTR